MNSFYEDEIVTEVRKARQKILESFGGDFEKMSRDAMKRQGSSGHLLVTEPFKKFAHENKAAEARPEYKAGA